MLAKLPRETGAHLFLVLWKAYRAVEAWDRGSIERTGLCFSDFATLEICLHKGPTPVNAIGKKVLLTSGSITSAVDRLEKKGLVMRERNPKDARSVLVRLTAAGKKLISDAYDAHARRLDEVAEALVPFQHAFRSRRASP
ncbi:MAG: MarR family winged helix-turn-helix transcriptional regulator [Terrimicrobiaceae bacterium]